MKLFVHERNSIEEFILCKNCLRIIGSKKLKEALK
jgi:hypothetical protein